MTGRADTGIELARPDIGARERELVLEALGSGKLSLGPMLERFEEEFAAWLGVDHAVAVSSGTAALHLGVRSAGWSGGDEVVTSPLSFVASANCLLYEGARPVFADVAPETWNLDPERVEEAIGPATAGILPVHIYGFPADLQRLEAIAARHGLEVLEDACEALGAHEARGWRVGCGSSPATFGFYANKQLTTGEGGMLVTGDREVADRARSERNQGRGADMGWLDHERLGFNYRLPELACALGIAQVERLGPMLAARDRLADLYAERLAGTDGVEVPVVRRGSERRSWFVLVVRLTAIGLEALEGRDDTAKRDSVITALAGEGIPAKAYMPCLHLIGHLRELGYREGQFPVAESIAATTLALPFHPGMGEEEVERVCGALQRAIGI